MKNTLKTMLLSSLLFTHLHTAVAADTSMATKAFESVALAADACYHTAEQSTHVTRDLGECLVLLGKCTAHWTFNILPQKFCDYMAILTAEKSAQDAAQIAELTVQVTANKFALIATEAARQEAAATAALTQELIAQKTIALTNVTEQLANMTAQYNQAVAQAASPTVVFKAVCSWAQQNPKVAALTAATVGLTLAVGARCIYNNCNKFIKGGMAALNENEHSARTVTRQRIDTLTYNG